MALTTIAAVKVHIGIIGTSEDAFLTQLLVGVEAAFLKLIDRDISLQTYTEYYSGNGMRAINLREYPVREYQLTGTLTSGSAVVTGISSTTNLAAGMPVVGAHYLPAATGVPAGTTISTVDSTTQVTMSAAATLSGSTELIFGLAVWEDPIGYWGTSEDAFGSGKELIEGTDFSLVRDGRGALAEVGRLYRIGQPWPSRWEARPGLLATARKPGAGNIKVRYAAGYASVPSDIPLALWQSCAVLRQQRKFGTILVSDSYQGYSYSLQQIEDIMTVGSTAQVVSKYKRVTKRHETFN